MQLDYYRSPHQDETPRQGPAPDYPGVPPPGAGRARPRRKQWPVALIVFLALIAALALALLIVRIWSPGGLGITFTQDGITQRFDGFDFSFGDPDDFSPQYDATSGQDAALTTIPRADPDPGVQLLLTGLPEQPLSFQEIYEKVIPSIVSVRSYSDTGAYIGTGVVMTAEGYIITNHHIIAGCSAAQVVLSDGTAYEAKLVGSDAYTDLAVLKIGAQELLPAEFGDSNLLRVGDTALAIGNPLGAELFGTMTDGIISAINRDVNVDGYTMTLIQTTAALNQDNSGGALVNSAGQVVGITNMKMMSSYTTIEGLGFAIPTACAKEVVDTLLADGAITGRPTIGIICRTISYGGDAALNGLNSGVYVDSVTAGGPAAQAGVQPGDVIIAANGQPVADLEDLTAIRDETGVGGHLSLTVWRDGASLELTLTLVDQYELN